MQHGIGDIIGAAAGLLDTRARLAARRFERAGVRTAAMMIAALVAACGLGLLLAGGLIALANNVGWAGALGLCGAGAATVGAAPLAVVAWWQRRGGRARAGERVLEARAALWREQLAAALGADGRTDNSRGSQRSPAAMTEILHTLVGQALANPAQVVAGIVAVSGLLGFGRTWRLLAKAAVLSGSLLPLLQRMTDWLVRQQEADRRGRAAAGTGDGAGITPAHPAGSDGVRVGPR